MKTFPCACYKYELKTRLNGVSEEYLNDLIYKAIQDFRGYTLEQAKKVRLLTKKEARYVMIEVGEIEPTEFN